MVVSNDTTWVTLTYRGEPAKLRSATLETVMSTGRTESRTTTYRLLQVLRRVIEKSMVRKRPTYVNHRNVRGVDSFYDQLGDTIALVNWTKKR